MSQTTRSPAARWKQARAQLLEFEDVIEVTAHAGEVLVYAGHQPPGLFLCSDARLELLDPEDRHPHPIGRAFGGPFLFPALDDLGRASPGTIRLCEDASLVFLPRSLAAGSAELRALLERARFPSLGWDDLN